MKPNSRLYRQRGQRIYEGDALRTIAFPLGGIGTGNVSLGGRGQLTDWEIFNHPGKGKVLPFSFFALWVKPDGEEPAARLMESQMLPPFNVGGGIPPSLMAGLPRFRDARFFGEYPFAWLDLSDPDIPLALRLRAWNPMVPLNEEDSGIPAALFDWHIVNTSDRAVDISVCLNVLNAVGWDGDKPFGGRSAPWFGGNINTLRTDGPTGLRGVVMTNERLDASDARYGSMAISTPWPEGGARAQWERGGWFDDLQAFWDDFREDGSLREAEDAGPSPDGQTDVAAVWATARLSPGDAVDLPFIMSWSFPNLCNTWNAEEKVRGKRLGNFYALRHPDAWEAAVTIARERERLAHETSAFHEALFSSTLPDSVLDAVSANMSIVRTTTCFRTADGRLNAFEGCNDTSGCCPMNCTHVWNYAQTVAYLYPALERTVRETDFGHNTDPSGDMSFRTLLPLIGERWGFRPAADGQMGTIARLYREWRFSGDTAWLKSLWPAAKKALEFAWSPENRDAWDVDRDGVMEGIQHNTYDIEFVGPNSMMGGWYLAALRAASEMARAVEDPDADAYAELAERGAAGYDAVWNGDYYEQSVRFDAASGAERLTKHGISPTVDGDMPRYQYGPGCLSDQLVGQWFAACVGLGDVLPKEKTRSALRAIVAHNLRTDLSHHESCQRTYALNDEGGLLLCSWPHGGRPDFPFPYADEVWTGIEYHVAAHLIYEGMVSEGLAIVETVRARFDGAKRNPWDEFECGHHYARAMSSWSLLLAWSGFRYNAPDGAIGFNPCVSGEFRCFFSTGSAWGVYERAGEQQTLNVLYGTLTLRRWTGSGSQASVNGRLVSGAEAGGLAFPDGVTLSAGDVLLILP